MSRSLSVAVQKLANGKNGPPNCASVCSSEEEVSASLSLTLPCLSRVDSMPAKALIEVVAGGVVGLPPDIRPVVKAVAIQRGGEGGRGSHRLGQDRPELARVEVAHVVHVHLRDGERGIAKRRQHITRQGRRIRCEVWIGVIWAARALLIFIAETQGRVAESLGIPAQLEVLVIDIRALARTRRLIV